MPSPKACLLSIISFKSKRKSQKHFGHDVVYVCNHYIRLTRSDKKLLITCSETFPKSQTLKLGQGHHTWCESLELSMEVIINIQSLKVKGFAVIVLEKNPALKCLPWMASSLDGLMGDVVAQWVERRP